MCANEIYYGDVVPDFYLASYVARHHTTSSYIAGLEVEQGMSFQSPDGIDV